MALAPIVLFTYNRANHTLKTLESLARNDLADQSQLFIYCDGPKANASEEDIQKIKEVRRVIRLKQWCANISIIESDVNITHPINLVQRITEIINKYGKIIVLEDDLILGQGFLKYMNDGLNLYQEEPRVMSISGYMFPVLRRKLPDTFFLRFSSAWGWATWKRAWDCFVHDPEELLNKIPKEKIRDFNIEGTYNFYDNLITCATGSWKFWDIRWYASIYIRNGLCLFPGKSLVRNIGHDNSGMHCPDSYIYNYQSIVDYTTVERVKLTENKKARKAVRQIYKILYDHSFFSINNFKNLIKKVVFSGLYNFLKRKKNEYLISRAH